MKIKDRTTN